MVDRPEDENGVTKMVENASHLMLLVASVILFHSNLI